MLPSCVLSGVISTLAPDTAQKYVTAIRANAFEKLGTVDSTGDGNKQNKGSLRMCIFQAN